MTALWQAAIGANERLDGWARRGSTELHVARLPRPAWPIVAGALARAIAERGKSVLILAESPERFADELRTWLSGHPPAYVFAEVGVSFLDRPPAFDEAVNLRLEALAALVTADKRPVIVVSSRRAMTRQTISRGDLVDTTVVLKPGETSDPVAVAGRLVELGYTREPLVEDRGQFSLRGGILDVFPAAADEPVRAEWSGNAIETLRIFDPENQRSVMAVEEATIRTGRELLIGQERGRAAVDRLRESVSLGSLRGDVRSEWEDELTRLRSGAAFAGVEFYAAYLNPSRPSLMDHVTEVTVVIDFEPGRQAAEARGVLDEAEMLAAAEATGGELPRQFALPIASPIEDFGRRARLTITSGEGTPEAIDLGWFEGEPLVGQPRALAGFAARSEGASILFATEQDERLRALLDEAGVRTPLRELDLDLDLELDPALGHAAVDIAAGCAQPEIGFHLATDAELFGRVRRPSRTTRTSRTNAEELTREFTLDFAPDELVVHVDHGIARFKGMRLIESEGAHREYLELEYAEGDRLFVPVENLDRVQKYLGGAEGTPALHRLGTSDWTRARGRARKVVQDVADELLKIYSMREARPGIAFAPDTAWQQELEASFPYEETPDQVAAMAEIKADMESDRPMDRLLCGDVGFGKTELALRAAFKAAMSGKQVALLAPTTVLAQQHFHVFRERLKNFPVVVEML
ncbi:MAG TPA: CarD family transcriptional regulator, partial [Candidatus Dormibacteraeota bacterium]|nr:CarD family transcriptional regulator [Candidatus Dormibacteraeota bacterium]